MDRQDAAVAEHESAAGGRRPRVLPGQTVREARHIVCSREMAVSAESTNSCHFSSSSAYSASALIAASSSFAIAYAEARVAYCRVWSQAAAAAPSVAATPRRSQSVQSIR